MEAVNKVVLKAWAARDIRQAHCGRKVAGITPTEPHRESGVYYGSCAFDEIEKALERALTPGECCPVTITIERRRAKGEP